MSLPRTAGPSSWLGMRKALTFGLALVAAGGAAIVPVTVQQAVDRRGHLTLIAGVGAAGLVVAMVCAYRFEARLIRRTEALLDLVRVEAFQHMAERTGPPGAARAARARRAAEDLDRASQFVRWTGPGLLLNAGRLLVTISITAVYSWEITVVMLAAVGAIGGVQSVQRRRARGAVRAVLRRELELRSAIVRLVLRARHQQSHEDRRRAQSRAEAAVTDRMRDEVRLARRQVSSAFVHELGMGVVLAALLVGGAYLGAHREITAGELAGLLLAVTLVVAPVQAVAAGARAGADALTRWGRVQRTCLRDDQATDPVRERV